MTQKAITSHGESDSMVLKPGLEGVPVTQSAICDIDGTKGELRYRGYSISELAYKSSFLETAYLLIWGELPTAKELREFEDGFFFYFWRSVAPVLQKYKF